MPSKSHIGLRRWIWRAFAQSALIPLLLVETLLISIYLLSNSAIRDAQIDYLRQNALTDLQSSASLEARIIDEQLAKIGSATELYRNLTARALLADSAPAAPELALSADGVRYSPTDHGGAAVFYSNVTPAARQDLAKVARLSSLEPLMKELKDRHPLIASLYFNSWDSLNHIYPWFNTLQQYPHDMTIPDFNFYYLADAKHNPTRQPVWTDVYLDPAGQGWMMSAIAPVYRGDFLEGVSGVDITVSGLLQQIDQLQIPWNGYAMLVSADLNIMVMPKQAENDFGLNELTTHTYDEALRSELFKPEDFNLQKRVESIELAKAMAEHAQGIQPMLLGGRKHLVAWTTISQTGWHLVTIVEEDELFSQTKALAGRYERIGYVLIAGLVLFYLLFFAFMWVRALQLSRHLRVPIDGISRMMGEIGQGHWRPQPISSEIVELAQVARHTSAMGEQLEHLDHERALAQQRLELVLESATESLWERNSQTRMIRLRGRFVTRFGLSEAEISDETFLQRVHPDDRAQIKATQQHLNDSDENRYETEFRFADRDGQYHWLLSRGRVIERDPQTNRIIVLAGTHVDIGALKQIEADLRTATLEAQAASKAKSRFISSITHELRTPLNAIYGFAQLMRIDTPATSSPEQSDYLDEILQASRHLNQLVDDILDLSSVQAEKPQLTLHAVDVAPLMTQCAEMVRVEVQAQGLHLNLDLPETPLQVQADPRRLRQVLINLLSNAIKYNRTDGHITLSYQVAAGHIRLLVEDTGLGISAELQQQLFEPFQRLGRENTAIQGTGIGLSLCREFASLMHGQMGVHSEPGIGSCFWIELPLVEALAPSAVDVPESARPRVFYVEDNPASQFLVRKALADLADVRVASSGRAALEQMLAEPPDLLLLDFNLPDMDGETLLRQLRAQQATRGLPVVVLTAAAEAARVVMLDCQGLLAKPIDVDELRGLVRALLHEEPPHAS